MTEPKPDYPIADVGAQRVAAVYAQALFSAALKQGQADAVFEELDSLVRDLFPADPAFELLLGSPAVGRKQRSEILTHIFSGRASEIFLNFLLVLNDHDRLDLLRAILTGYRELADQRARRVRVQVQSAVPLPEDQQQRLQQNIRETFHVEPVVETRVDAGLLGGLRVRIGDWLYDASVSTQLEIIRKQILARSSHEIQSRRDRFCVAEGN